MMKTLKIITALLAVITAVMLILWVIGVTDSESTKEAILKVATISGIAAALAAVLQVLTGNKK
jgi:hypothetical protein